MKKNNSLPGSTTLTQKIILILGGIFLSVIILEIGLRLGGFFVLSLQEYRNRTSLRQKSGYRIMCLGESTTQGQYPVYLEEILNQNSTGLRFSVIDKGVGATNSTLILSQLEGNIQRYRPDMIIVMMGINDGGAHMPQERATSSKIIRFLRNFKTYKLMRLLKMHAVTKIANFIQRYQRADARTGSYLLPQGHNKHDKAIKITSLLMSSACRAHIELGKRYVQQGKIGLAEEEFRKVIAINPRSTEAYLRLAWLPGQKDPEELIRKIAGVLKEAIEIEPEDMSVKENYSLLGANIIDCYAEYVDAEEIFKKILEFYPDDYNAYLNLGRCYRDRKEYALSEKMFQKAIELGADNLRAFQNLAVLYNEMGNYKLSEEYFKKADDLGASYYSPETIKNYKTMKSILGRLKIKLVCVQYPMQSSFALMSIFAGQEDIIFVDNEKIFKEAVIRSGYKEYFRDNFSGDFGHCTPKGNRLLAENIARAILK